MFEYIEIDDRSLFWLFKFKSLVKHRKFDRIIGFMLPGALISLKITSKIPIWIDLNGDPLIEKLAMDDYYKNEYGTIFLRKSLLKIFKFCEIYSVCSDSQKKLLLGGILYKGYISNKNFNYPIVNTIYPVFNNPSTREIKVFSKEKRTPGVITILFNGSINSWTDVQLLYKVIKNVLIFRPNVRFIQFGKTILLNNYASEFKSLANDPEFKGRVFFYDEVSSDDADCIYRQSDICVSADKNSLETRFGYRNRYIEALKYGLVIVGTFGNDLAEYLSNQNIGKFLEINDEPGFISTLLSLIDDADLRRELSGNSAKVLDNLNKTIELQIIPLINWLNNPGLKAIRNNQYHYFNLKTILRNYFSSIRFNVFHRLS